MTLTFKVTLSRKVEFSNLAEKLKYSKFEQDSFNIKDLKGQNIIFVYLKDIDPLVGYKLPKIYFFSLRVTLTS